MDTTNDENGFGAWRGGIFFLNHEEKKEKKRVALIAKAQRRKAQRGAAPLSYQARAPEAKHQKSPEGGDGHPSANAFDQ